MKKIIKKYGNSAVVVLTKEDMKAHKLKIGKKLDFEITKKKYEYGKDILIVHDMFKENILKKDFPKKAKIIFNNLASLDIQETKDNMQVVLKTGSNISKEFLIFHLKEIVKELESEVSKEKIERNLDHNKSKEDKLNKSILRYEKLKEEKII